MSQKLDDELWNHTLVLIECPICNDTILVSSLDILDKTIAQMWKIFGKYFEQYGSRENYKKAIATAGIMNQKDRILNIFKERGIIQVMCRTCLTNEQQKLLNENGQSIVRIGNLLVDAEYYRKNRKFLQKEIKENQLDLVTFWT